MSEPAPPGLEDEPMDTTVPPEPPKATDDKPDGANGSTSDKSDKTNSAESVVPTSRGTIKFVDSERIVSTSRKDSLKIQSRYKHYMTYLFQVFNLDPTLTVQENRKIIREKRKNLYNMALANYPSTRCKVVQIANFPNQFNFVHVRGLLEIFTNFDTNSEFYLIDVVPGNKKIRSECFIRFMNPADCQHVFANLQKIVIFGRELVVVLDNQEKRFKARVNSSQKLKQKLEFMKRRFTELKGIRSKGATFVDNDDFVNPFNIDLTKEEQTTVAEYDSDESDADSVDDGTNSQICDSDYTNKANDNDDIVVQVRNLPKIRRPVIFKLIRQLVKRHVSFFHCSINEGPQQTVSCCRLKFLNTKDAKEVFEKLNGVVVAGCKVEAKLMKGFEFVGLNLLYRLQKDDPVDLSIGFLPMDKAVFNIFGLKIDFLNKLGIKPPLFPSVTVENLHMEVDETKLLEVFSLAGIVTRISLFIGKKSPKATIDYDHPIEAVQAVSLFHGHALYGKKMQVTINKMREERLLPLGLASIGQGLGEDGIPLRGVRTTVEINRLNKILESEKHPQEPPLQFVPNKLPGSNTVNKPVVVTNVNPQDKNIPPNALQNTGTTNTNLDNINIVTLVSALSTGRIPPGTNLGNLLKIALQNNIPVPDNLRQNIAGQHPNMPGAMESNPNMPGAMGSNPNMPGAMGPNRNMPGVMDPNPNMPGLMGPNQNVPGLLGPKPNMPGLLGHKPNMPGLLGHKPNMPGLLGHKPNIPSLMGPIPNMPGVIGPSANIPGALGPNPNMPGVMDPNANMPGAVGPNANMTGAMGPNQNILGAMGPNQNIPGAMGPNQNIPSAMGPNPNMPRAMGPNPNMLGAMAPNANMPGIMGLDPNMICAMGFNPNMAGTMGLNPNLANQGNALNQAMMNQFMLCMTSNSMMPNMMQPNMLQAMMQANMAKAGNEGLVNPNQMTGQNSVGSATEQNATSATGQNTTSAPSANQVQPAAEKPVEQPEKLKPSRWNDPRSPSPAVASTSASETSAPETSQPAKDSKHKDQDKSSSDSKKGDTLMFKYLPPSVSADALARKMREVGDLMFSELTGKGRAVVRFKTATDAKRCYKLFHKSKVDGHIIEPHHELIAGENNH